MTHEERDSPPGTGDLLSAPARPMLLLGRANRWPQRLARATAAVAACAVLLGCAGLAGQAAAPSTNDAAAPSSVTVTPALRQALAPTGTLRIGVYAGSPTSMVQVAGSGDKLGLTVEIGRELARRLSVPAEIVEFPRVAEVVEALKSGRADFTITNATPARSEIVDFAPTVVALELGMLALPDGPVQAFDKLADLDRAGVRIGVSQGSTSQGVLTRALQRSRVVPAPSLQAAGQMLQRREIDAFATNKGILFEMADRVPGARVLAGRWGLEQLAVAVPKGRGEGAAYLRAFTEAVAAQGLVRQAAARAGLRGLAEGM